MKEITSNNISKWGLYAVIALFSIYILWLNIISPFLCGDDFIFQLKIPADGVIGSESIQSLSDLIESQINFYKNYHYRIINHTVLQVILLLPPIVFDVLNTFVFLLLPWVVLKISKPQLPFQYLTKYATILLFIWIFHFSLGWCYFPVTGALNYTWMLIPQLWFLAIILEYREGHQHKWSLIILALVNSMANENVCVSLFLLTLWILWETRNRKDSTLYICLAIMVLGGVFMLSSPSVGKRLATQGHRDAGFVQHFLEYGRRVIYYCIRYSPIFFLLIIGGKNKVTLRSKEILLFIVFLVATGIMIIVPLFEPRSAVFGFFVLLMMTTSLVNNAHFKPLGIIILVVVSFYLCISRAPAFLSLQKNYKLNHEILSNKSGADQVRIHKYCEVTTHDYILCQEVSEDPKYFDNKTVAAFYGVNEVSLKDDYVIEKHREKFYKSIESDQTYLDQYDSIEIDGNTDLFYKESEQGLDVIIQSNSNGADDSFYIFRACRKGSLKHLLVSLFPKGLQLYFLDYAEDLTKRSQEKLQIREYSYNYNLIFDADKYSYILISKYSFEKHSPDGIIFKLDLE